MSRVIQIKSLKNQRLIADKCFVADRFWSRLRGLIGKSSLKRTEAVWFPQCSSVHTWWMRFSIDVVFLRQSRPRDLRVWTVVSIRSSVAPWTLLPVSDWKATDVLEMAAGAAEEVNLKPGDEVECIG